ncbi:MAG: ATP-binding protein [Ginsengibacter sp.]
MENEHMLRKKFAALQKELSAKNRELEIEASLERVRTRSLAMQSSDELLDASDTMFAELAHLSINALRIGICTMDAKTGAAEIWSRSETNKWKESKILGIVPRGTHPVFDNMVKAWKGKKPSYSSTRKGTEVKEYYEKLAAHLSYLLPGRYNKEETITAFFFPEGSLNVVSLKPLSKSGCAIMLRFAKVFGQIYTRFLDLQKAEAQAREAKIENALEKVRSQSMAMHHSENLHEVINTLTEQLEQLGFYFDTANFITDYTKDGLYMWVSTPGVTVPSRIYIPFADLTFSNILNDAVNDNLDFISYTLSFDEKNDFFRHFFENTDGKYIPEERKQFIYNSRGLSASVVLLKNVFLTLANYQAIPYTEDENAIIKRFGNVFGQSYTRFLDLQKAEAQAREAKIEAALERTRTQSMIMQHSDELDDTLRVFHEQVQLLGINSAFSFLWLPDEEKEQHIFWAIWEENENGSVVFKNKAINYPLDRNEPATKQCLIDWKSDEPVVSYAVPPEGVENYFAAWQELIDGVEKLKPEHFRNGLYYIEAFMKYGCFGIMMETDLNESEKKTLGRFAIEFERTYTRFLDLQKAEAQAREAMIEASLERVRSRSMAMHKSDEVMDVAVTVYDELQKLDFKFGAATIIIMDEKTGNMEHWLAGFIQKNHVESYQVNNSEHPLHAAQLAAWREGAKFDSIEMSGPALKSYAKEMFTQSGYKNLPDEEKAMLLANEHAVFNMAYMSNGALMWAPSAISDENAIILQRFAKVFEQTYTRFLDLQKAEAQAREAQIEAALERVRSRSLGMQKSEELKEVIQIVFEQLRQLNFAIDSAHFNLNFKESDDYNLWSAAPNQPYPVKTYIPFFDHPVFIRAREAKEKGLDFFTESYTQEEKNTFFEHLFKHSPVIPDERRKYILSGPGVAASSVLMNTISLWIMNYAGTPYSEAENTILKRFGKIFEQSYTRFLDLQKAEAQAREAQIEAALEKVRSRSLGMQKSEELKEVIQVVYNQFIHLNISVDHAGFVVDYIPKSDWQFWIADMQDIPSKIAHPYFESVWANQFDEAKEKGADFFATNLNFEEKNKFYNELLSYVPGLPEASKDFYLSCPGLAGSTVLFNNVSLYIENFSRIPYSDEENKILMRFGKVFEQTYTRFLDLQKAEAQAKEAQIESALEKVRSRSLSMHKSDELPEVVRTVFDRLNELDVIMNAASIFIFKDGSNDLEQWVALSGHQYSTCFHLSYFNLPMFRDLKEAREKEKDSFVKKYSFQEKNDWFRFAFEHTDYRQLPDARKKYLLESDSAVFSYALTKNTGLQLANYDGQLFSEREIEILERFARVFEQAYTRFLDLQKAEAQAREAQIQLALERVRARTMAMHSSEELAETAKVFFEQFDLLGKIPDRMSIGIINEESKKVELWVTDQSGNQVNHEYFFSLDERTSIAKIYKAWKESKETIVIDLIGENLQDWLQFVKEEAKLPIDETKIKGRRVQQAAFFRQGFLLFTTHEPVADEIIQLLARFARVFEQTYTRFLDLQRAEAQAREAQIEGALERVRAKTMAMYSSEDVSAATATMFDELEKLNLQNLRGGILNISENETMEVWSVNTLDDGKIVRAIGLFDMTIHPWWRQLYKGWKSKDELLYYFLAGNEKEDYLRILNARPDYLPNGIQGLADCHIQTYYFNEGGIWTFSIQQHSEENKQVMKRFASVFSLTFRRYKDLKHAEAQAKEAVKASSLDRVRGEIASMRNAEDLNRITPLIWHELTTLGVPFIRCGVFIIDEGTAMSHVYLSSPHGQSLGVLNLPFGSNELTTNAVDHWRKGMVYHQHWNKEEFITWTKSLMAQGQIQNQETFQGAASPPEKLDLHFIPFMQGLLYVGSTNPLTHDEIDLVKALAEAFSIAYARYEDFKRLEKAKESIELTLTELKSAQAQLIQSEKMASLGELTAGIAHEIQNPLNFVNNFSEVNKELLAELNEEIEKKNYGEVRAITRDIIANEEKINHHGKRADEIVKGMLQHSRASTGQKEPTNINALADEYLRLSYHGMRAKDKSFNATFNTDFGDAVDKINIIPQDIGRVLLNLYNNAFYAVNEKKNASTSSAGQPYEPKVTVSTKAVKPPSGGLKVLLTVTDNGNGIPQSIIEKIFQPFFTSKPTGQGTGLGLSLSYDIIKAHGGEIIVETKEGEGTGFIIQIPVV